MAIHHPLVLGGCIERRPGALSPGRSVVSCAYCGISSSPYDTVGDVVACPLCQACLTLDRQRIDEEFVLIWLPEVSQPAINHLARCCHAVFYAHGEAPHLTRRPRIDTPALRAAYRAFHSLLVLSQQASEHLGTTSPRDLWSVLASLPDNHMKAARARIQPARMLPLGHYYRDGRDIYPDIMDAWSAPGGSLSDLAS